MGGQKRGHKPKRPWLDIACPICKVGAGEFCKRDVEPRVEPPYPCHAKRAYAVPIPRLRDEQLTRTMTTTTPRKHVRGRRPAISGNCKSGHHHQCFSLGCPCPCGHKYKPEAGTK